ncbi:PAS domain S-box protein [Microcoleus sp. bin38.metabat.b11b12b14.051]|uniref:PAS domain-containing sensor histidine kinase n=1 Tax=Microcoleus sp. bin38.metabat.b11b12b14.051 TaxID=2742709 RepID=UPI0025E77611|nr:PAS domain S-box protein [Microcoleus sp. bin38.metabat.b11b12b14.051]
MRHQKLENKTIECKLENKAIDCQNIEEALHQMEAKYYSMFENAVSGIFQTTKDGRYLSANPALARIYGYNSAAELMDSLTDISDQLYVNRDRRAQFISALQAQGVVSDFESQIYRRDGTVIWIVENARAVCDEGEKLLYYEGFVEDITQRKNAESAMRESEERLRMVIEGVKDYAIFMLDTKGYVASWNSGAKRILGYEASEIISKNSECFYTAEDIANNLPQEKLATATAAGRYQSEGWRFRQDGSRFWAKIIVTPLRDESGELQGFSQVMQDITQQKQAGEERMQLIASLQASEKKFRTLYESTTDAVMLLDEEGFLDCNPATLKLFGCSTESEFCGKHPSQFSPLMQPDGQDSMSLSQQWINTALETGNCRFDWRHCRLDGSEFPAEVLLTSMDIGGKMGLQAVVRDITDRVQAQVALKQANEVLEYRVKERTSQLEDAIKQLSLSEEKFSKAFRSSPDPMTITTFAEGRFLEANDSFLSTLGYLREEIFGHTVPELNIWTRPQDRVDFRQSLHEKGVVRNQECEFMMKSGSAVVCLLSAELINLEGELCMLTVMTDITDRKHAEEALRESQRALSTLMSNLPGMAYRFRNDADRSMEFVSEGCYQLSGYSPEEFIGTGQVSLSELTHPDDREIFCNAVEIALQENQPYQLNYRITCKNGELKWVWEQGLGVYSDSGELLALEGLITDISEQKRSEEALVRSQAELTQQKIQLEHTLEELQQTQAVLIHTEKMSTLGQMVAGVAHEINNPVSSVCGNLVHVGHYTEDLLHLIEMYQKNCPQPPASIQKQMEDIELEFLLEDLPKAISSMQVGADRIREIVRSLRNFSRKDDSQMTKVNLHEGIEGTLLILQSRLRARGNYPEIAVIKEYGSLPLVECYSGKINQVFMNLIGNAIDAIEEYNAGRSVAEAKTNRSKIKIKTEVQNSNAVIRISDNGPGMPQEVCQQLFEAFFTTKPAGKGTGLGLSISYKVLQEHSGMLSCVSAPGQGAEFIIEMPIEQISQLTVDRRARPRSRGVDS